MKAMRIEVRLPQLSMGMSDAEVVEWLVSEGDRVADGDDLLEIEAEKARMTLPAPAAGKVVDIQVEPEDVVDVQGLLCYLETE